MTSQIRSAGPGLRQQLASLCHRAADAFAAPERAVSGEDPGEAFLERFDRWAPELVAGLTLFASHPAGASLADRVLDLMLAADAERRPALRRLDRERLLRPDWFAGPDQVGYNNGYY